MAILAVLCLAILFARGAMAAHLVLTQKIEVRVLAGEPVLLTTLFRALAFAWVPLISSAFLTGCSVSQPSQPTQIQVEIDNANSSTIDAGAQNSAEALHSYLVGQLQYLNRDFDQALASLEHVSELVGAPVPEVNAQMTMILLRRGEIDRALEESNNAVIADPNDIKIALINAGLLEARGQFANAAESYRRILAMPNLAPQQSLEAALLLAQIYIHDGNINLAQSVLDQQVKDQREGRLPDSALLNFAIGQASEKAGEFAKAESAYARAYEIDPSDNALLLDALRAALKGGQTDRIIALGRQVREIAKQGSRESEGESGNGLRELSDIILLKEDYTSALKHLGPLEKQESDPLTWRMKIALIFLQQQKFPDAARQLQLSLALRPESNSARYILGSIYAGTGQPKEALAELLKIPTDDELYIRSRTFAAIIYRQEKNLPGAEKVIREGLVVEPENPLLVSYLVSVLRDQNKFGDAVLVLNESLKRDPDNEKVLFNLGQVLHEQGRESEAMAVMERVIKINPRHAEATNFVAYGLAEGAPSSEPERSVALDRALDLAQLALVAKPEDGYLLDTLGWIYFQRGELTEARETLERAMAQIGNDGVIAEHYADVLVASRENDKASTIYAAILDADSGEESAKQSDNPKDKKERKELRERVKRKLEDLKSNSQSASLESMNE